MGNKKSSMTINDKLHSSKEIGYSYRYWIVETRC